jgi:conflict system pore-forming effector with SLATT domain
MSAVGGSDSASQDAGKPAVSFGDTNDLPGLFRAADSAAILAQKRFFSGLRAELVLLSLAAAVALFSTVKQPAPTVGPFSVSGFTTPPLSVATLASALFIILALVIRVFRYVRHFDTQWYEARAAAESVKSLAWRYAVGGRPFPLDGDEVGAKARLLRRLNETLMDVARDLSQTTFTPEQQITPAMERLRGQPLEARRASYRAGRIVDQEKWYTNKSKWNKTRGLQWHWAMMIIEALGAAGAVAVAFQLLPFSPQGLVAAIVSGIISWTQSRRYQDLYASYRVTASELGSIEVAIPNQTDEAAWSTFVDEAEEACSREHRLWRATRDD